MHWQSVVLDLLPCDPRTKQAAQPTRGRRTPLSARGALDSSPPPSSPAERYFKAAPRLTRGCAIAPHLQAYARDLLDGLDEGEGLEERELLPWIHSFVTWAARGGICDHNSAPNVLREVCATPVFGPNA